MSFSRDVHNLILELPANRIASFWYFSLLSSCSKFLMSFSHERTSERCRYFATGEQESRTSEIKRIMYLRIVFCVFCSIKNRIKLFINGKVSFVRFIYFFNKKKLRL